jgi:NTE family protein
VLAETGVVADATQQNKGETKMHGTLFGSSALEAGDWPSKPTESAQQKVINLALQGGGSHGALTWGVLDRLLEDKRLVIEGITATSAGAINAVVLADGLAAGGREGARNALRQFWQKMSQSASLSIFQPSPIDKINPRFGLEHSPGYLFMEAVSYYSSPYQFNPFNYNPLKTLLEEVIDFERVRQQRRVKLFLSATNVRTSKVKVFSSEEINAEHVLASACLPLLMHAVEIDGEHYWDGGFAGNPVIFPVIYECEARDIVMIHLTPAERPELPVNPRAIMNRMQEISFNSSLIREMRAIAFLTKLIDEGYWTNGKRIFIHSIEGEDVIREFSGSSRVNGDWDLLSRLFKIGRERADNWLTSNFDLINAESTLDLEAKYF